MKITGVLVALVASIGVAAANPILVNNASFETLPPGGLPTACGAPLGCTYSTGGNIPGWTVTGGDTFTGQLRPGSASGNLTFFNYVPDGLTIGYTDTGMLSQTVAATAQAGVTYTLLVDVGTRADGFFGGPVVSLVIGGSTIAATGSRATAGNWATYTATYTALAADAGNAIKIQLSSTSTQGDFDNVRLSDSLSAGVPEPGTGMLAVLGLVGFLPVVRAKLRRRA
ncbi:MAG: hypothetical protein JST11_10155 [Acidobacteria bacterium]|nr:hypothetical protein [Acidobacteriota bacterium]